jgi:hypothetical protein
MRLPFYCGWIIVILTFVTIATGVIAGAPRFESVRFAKRFALFDEIGTSFPAI